MRQKMSGLCNLLSRTQFVLVCCDDSVITVECDQWYKHATQNSQNCHKHNITVGRHSLSTLNYSFQNVNCKVCDSLSVVFICKIILTVLTIVYEY